MKQIGIIINPNSKKFRTNKSSLRYYQNIKSDMLDIRQTKSESEIKTVIEDFMNLGYNYVSIAGGDGTLHLAITELINVYPPEKTPFILILKEGTMNNIARTISLKGKGPDLIKKLIWAIEREKYIEIHERDTIKIENKYCLLFGIGIITNFLNLVYSGKEKGFKRNVEVAILTVIEALNNNSEKKIFKNIEGEVLIDGKKIPFNNINAILSGTVEHVSRGFFPLINARSLSNAFQTIVTGMEPRKILININKLRRGKFINQKGYFNSMAHKMILKIPDEFEYTMDGEIYTAKDELVVETGPRIKLVKV